MTPIDGLFEVHLPVRDLDRAIGFYRDKLRLPLARIFPERSVAFFWVGAPGAAMLGLWCTGDSPLTTTDRHAFRTSIEALLQACQSLNDAGITPLNFSGQPAAEPEVLAWMPALSLYFRDPDGNLLEFLAMLAEPARPELGVVPWSAWRNSTAPR